MNGRFHLNKRFNSVISVLFRFIKSIGKPMGYGSDGAPGAPEKHGWAASPGTFAYRILKKPIQHAAA